MLQEAPYSARDQPGAILSKTDSVGDVYRIDEIENNDGMDGSCDDNSNGDTGSEIAHNFCFVGASTMWWTVKML